MDMLPKKVIICVPMCAYASLLCNTHALGFLELINNMLTSGMVPALFPDDEKEAINGQVRKLSVYIIPSPLMHQYALCKCQHDMTTS